MKYLNLCVFLLLLSISSNATANSGTIHGSVLNPEDAPIQAVTIRLMELKKQTSTNAKGEFQFENIPHGKYSLKLSRAGCRPVDTVIIVSSAYVSAKFVMYDVYRIKENIVVTGTRTAKQIESNPIATDVVTSESIQSASRLRLDNVLNEELGMVLVESHGKGIQIQGLDPDYALILLNGEPLIGRNGGILDLKRLSMGNIQRVEVVKGPSSSLYGSNALAGVINLITNEADKPFSLRANARYESFNTIDVGTEIGMTNHDNMIGNNFFINRLSSDGFKLTEESYGKAVPEYVNYSFTNDFFYKFNHRTSAKLGIRFNSEDQVNWFNVTSDGLVRKVDDNSSLRDYGISFSSKHQYNELHNVEARAYYTKYQTSTNYTFQDDGSRYDRYTFDQSLGKIELQTNRMLAMKHILTFGGGYVYEDVKAERLNHGIVTASSFFAFLQEDWLASKKVNVLGSIRYDWHSDYASSISPKLALSWNIFDNFIFKASIGSGFKAPTFQQLYLDWTNSIAGYSVFGVTFFEDRFNQLLQYGIIRDILVPVESVKDLQPERSISFNFGFIWDFLPNADVKVNMFRNNISEMIETLPVANKLSGAQVFSYFNLRKVFTQGLETSARYSLFRKFHLSIGYQYLEAFDVNVLKDLDNKKIWVTENGRDRAVRKDEYGGLFNRSRHSANLKLEFDDKDLGLNVFLRGNFRGRYGFTDRNNSKILDADKEYSPGYSLWNITASKDLPLNLHIQVGVDNIFDYYDPQHLFSNPGRTFYINLVYRFIKH